MTKILITYSTTDGQTQKICVYLQQILESTFQHITVVSVDHLTSLNLTNYDKVIIGASIRYGKHSKAIYDFIQTNHEILKEKKSAFFSVNVVARKPNKNTVETNPYINKFLKQISWQPNETAVFAGKIDYKKYNFIDRTMIRFIMWMTKGPTDPQTSIEFTDWNQVESFAKTIQTM